MAKKSYKRPSWPAKKNAGWMWSVLRFFGLRRGKASQKQLLDREHGRDMPLGNGYSKVQLEELNKFSSNVDGSGSGRSSVKTLMEEEMSQEYPQRKMSSDYVQSMSSDSISKYENRKNYKQSTKSKVISDASAVQLTDSASFTNHQSEIINLTEISSHNFDPASLLVELCSYGNRCQETLDVSNNVMNLYIALHAICEKMQIQLDEPELLPDQSYPILRRALSNIVDDSANQNSVIEKQMIGETNIQAKEVMDALKVLNSNKELLLKLFQDSISFKHIHHFQSSPTEKFSDQCTEKIHLSDEENCNNSGKYVESVSTKALHIRSNYSSLWKVNKRKEAQPSKEGPSSHSFSRIVLLKPNPSRIQSHSVVNVAKSSAQSHHNLGYKKNEENVVSYFSTSQIKRRLKRVFGERKREEHVVSLDSVWHKIPIESKDSSVTGNQFHNEPAMMSTARNLSGESENPFDNLEIFKNKDKNLIQEKYTRTIKNDSSSSIPGHLIHEEAKKRIAELLADDQTDSLPRGHISRSLERILFSSEYNVSVSPISSFREREEIILSSKEAEYSLVEKIPLEETINLEGPSSQNLEASFCSGDDQIDRVNYLDPRTRLATNDVEDNSSVPEDFNSEGSLDTAEADDIISELASHRLKPLSELIEDSWIVDNSFSVDNTTKGQEKLSPLSVLQTICSSEDITSPECTSVYHCKRQMQRFNAEDNVNPSGALMSLDRESFRASSDVSLVRSQYIRALLEASGLTNNALSERWIMADQLLDSSLFDEVKHSSFPLQDDEKLLFDCINEVLVEIQERFYICSANLSFVRSSIRPAPSGEKLTKEVTKGIEWFIRTQSKPVDEIIETDMDKEELIDIRLATENIVIDIWRTVLDNLLEEIVFDLWF